MTNKPIKKYSSGNFSIAVWLNQKEVDGHKIDYKSVSLTRSWRDSEGTWRSEHINLRRQDIPNVLVLLNKVQEELYLSEEGDNHD